MHIFPNSDFMIFEKNEIVWELLEHQVTVLKKID